ncbi:G-protein coupled receptor Mth2-like [Ptiloglossa arizonensis]|uniref:G-protein coupled receptor Mth2-like n=1 Tax=Ptiloglossa arizonensis TaxID=3350558 RepID=UPI003F9F48D9
MKLAMRFCTVIRVISLILMYRVRFAGTEAVAEEKASFCHPSPFPGILLERNKTDRLENGSLVHNHLVYPVGSYRDFGNETYGCVCNLQACLRKCCPRNEMLDDQPKCTRLPDRLLGSNLVLDRSQLSREIQNISSVDELFVLFEDMMCSENTTKYMLEPEQYSEDAFVLERNGTLGTSWNVFPPWTYCIDRKQFSEKIIVLVCEPANSLPPRPSSGEASQSVTIIVSIPFFLATLLVYAIIPELKNLYGKTLMCYVASLFVAYTFLVLVKLFYIPFGLCSVIGKLPRLGFYTASFFRPFLLQFARHLARFDRSFVWCSSPCSLRVFSCVARLPRTRSHPNFEPWTIRAPSSGYGFLLFYINNDKLNRRINGSIFTCLYYSSSNFYLTSNG